MIHTAKFLVEHDRASCIGCGSCAALCPKHWKMNDDGKADITGGKQRPDGWQELEIGEKELEENKQAAESCPVNAIHLKKKESGEKII